MCAIPQLVLAPLNPTKPIVNYFQSSGTLPTEFVSCSSNYCLFIFSGYRSSVSENDNVYPKVP